MAVERLNIDVSKIKPDHCTIKRTTNSKGSDHRYDTEIQNTRI